MANQGKRVLAAIMFTDMVGFTALMHRDEALGRTKRQRHREVLESMHETHNGKIIQYFGDGSLSVFTSSVEALQCAMEIQLALKEPIEVPLRIGLHMGDIIIEADNVIGDAVNIASRIESFSVPGAVLMSNTVYEQIKSHHAFQLKSQGKFKLKNVEHPIGIYSLANSGLVVPDSSQMQGKGERLDKPQLISHQSKSGNPNEVIIKGVFEAMLQHLGEQSPEFAFYNSMKMANLPIDTRMLANFIVQDFPWPIGVELRKLFSGDRRNRDQKRMEQIFRVAERSTRFYLYCLLSQLWDECKNRKITLSEAFQDQIKGFGRLGFGRTIQLIPLVLETFVQNKINPFLNYQFQQWQSAGLLNVLSQIREKKEEDHEYLTEADCEELELSLTKLLIEFSFFASLKLVAIKEITVNRPKLELAKFNHTLKMLNSQHEDFAATEQVFDGFSDSHSVILFKSLANAREYLNLSPLVVDTSSILKDRQVPGIKNGIYLFNQYREGKYIFVHTSAAESASFHELPLFEVLEGQFKDLQDTLGVEF